jgi:dihydropteroate synthase
MNFRAYAQVHRLFLAMELDLHWGKRTYIMGIINVSPDSFSGDGVMDVGAAVEQGLRFVEEGADILDVGGESTRPGSARIDAQEELRRVLPVIRQLASRTIIPLSIDTSRAAVARRALDLGARIVNDVWALARDPDIAAVVAERADYVVLMHNREAPAVQSGLGGHFANVEYDAADIVPAVASELAKRVADAERAGISRRKIIIDPGIGFGKGVDQNLELLRHLRQFKEYPAFQDLPLLVGTSRKSVIGLTLKLPVEERLEGTLATLALSIAQGADLVRVHDVMAAVRCCRMADAIVRAANSGAR